MEWTWRSQSKYTAATYFGTWNSVFLRFLYFDLFFYDEGGEKGAMDGEDMHLKLVGRNLYQVVIKLKNLENEKTGPPAITIESSEEKSLPEGFVYTKMKK